MVHILNIETSTKVCSVSISKDGEDYLVKELESEHFSHSEKLNVFIESLIQESGLSLQDLSAIAVSAGPGSYTGLRIGSSSAKGLCFALNIPLIAVNTMQSMFQNVKKEAPNFDVYIPMIDARRMEVYAALYSQDGIELRGVQADVLEEGSFNSYIEDKQVLIFGNGAEKSRELFTSEQFQFNTKTNLSAIGMNKLSYQKFKHNQFEDLAYFEPNYLKDFIAGKPKKIL